ncbi:MAG: LysM peptidoglycan-binding domain-containing protein, partial [Hydrocarboniphaga effusa]|nr:LysM peptidoglycan-binding domain-containing protein [Hydrocarboniphaga effusa]
MTRTLALLLMAVALAGCAELYRWPDRMSGRTLSRAPVRDYEKAPAEGYYVVKPGEALYSIAFRHQLDFRDLAVWNDIGPDYLIRPGQVLRLTPPLIVAGGAAASAASVGSIQTRPIERREPQAAPTDQPLQPPPVYTWQWPTAGSVVKPFGDGSAKGMDIAGALGQPVLAAA